MHNHSAVPLRPRQKGFTLIELIVVLVILGILAAFAIPRFAGVSEDARRSAIQGLAGSLRSSSALVHGLALARGKTAASGDTVPLEGANITLVYGYPAASSAGITATILNLEGFDASAPAGTPPAITFTSKNAASNPATCKVVYTEATASGPAQVTQDVTNCS